MWVGLPGAVPLAGLVAGSPVCEVRQGLRSQASWDGPRLPSRGITPCPACGCSGSFPVATGLSPRPRAARLRTALERAGRAVPFGNPHKRCEGQFHNDAKQKPELCLGTTLLCSQAFTKFFSLMPLPSLRDNNEKPRETRYGLSLS